MNCLVKNIPVNSDEWKRSPVCDCENCQEFFRQLRATFKTGKSLDFRMKELAMENK